MNVTTSVRAGIAQATAAGAVEEEAGKGPDPDLAPPACRFLDLAARSGGVELVDVDRNAALAMEARGESDVVGVAVRQDDRTDVVERPTHLGERVDELAPLSGQAGIDDGDLAGILDQVTVDDIRADLVEGRRELHVGVASWGLLAFAVGVGYDDSYDT